MTVKQRKKRLSSIANKDMKEPVTAKESILAIAELNKLDGSYAPDKHISGIKIVVEYRDKRGTDAIEQSSDEGPEETGQAIN
jgi:hypothetical protein